MTRRGVLAAAAALTLAATTGNAAAREVVVYTAANNELHQAIIAAFQERYPDITVRDINLSTGPITERAIAEAANPQADVVYGVNNIALEQLKNAGVFEPYEPVGSPIPASFRDPDGFYVGHFATLMLMAVNTQRLAEEGLPMPTSWEDLIRPEYEGFITVAAPTKSGTGLSIFSTMLDMFGWNYIDNLHHNIFQYNESGSQAGRQAGSGESIIGLTYDTAVLSQVRAGLPVELVMPPIVPNVIEGGGLVAGGPNPEEGKLFLDFVASEDAAAILADFVGATAVPGYGNFDLSQLSLWQSRRPLDADEFKREWASRYEGS
ncbi:MAG: extracellular solute-binding protein [Rhodospirillaceae bacterium]|nr:extracellular solute-binding protein [Rhodospirillaceae bacterium]